MSTTAWLGVFDDLVAVLDTMPLADAQQVSDQARNRLEAAEIRRLADEVSADGDTTRARRMAKGSGNRSKASARRRAARAKAVANNRKLADDLDNGTLCEEKLDTIADTAEADPAAVSDDGFIDAIKNRSVDAGKRLARDRKTRARDAESQHKRQRRLRRAHRYNDKAAGMDAILLSGDDTTTRELWNLIRQRERSLRTDDIGLPTAEQRSYDQRLFDAAAELIRGVTGTAGRPSAVLTLTADRSDAATATMIGVGPITDAEARNILSRAGISVAIIDGLTGQPLWLGRNRRHASTAQFLALALRDQGCVLCGADWITCDAHHRTPWNAAAKGETNIDNLALLCPTCHHDLHGAQMTLEHLGDGTWKTRPATPDEIPPTRHTRQADSSWPSATGKTNINRPPDPGRPSSQAPAAAEPNAGTTNSHRPAASPASRTHHRRPGSRRTGQHDADSDGAPSAA